MAGDVNSENYVVIQGWMINDLDIKGNELIVYAIIYGFSQTEGQVFNGSLQYLANWTKSTKQGVTKNLKSLVEKGYIIKNDKYINGVKFCEYYATKFNRGMQQSLMGYTTEFNGGMQHSLTNNINNNKDNNISNNKDRFSPPSLEDIKEYCKSRNNNVDPKHFFDYFNESNWVDSKGNKVKNWKQKVITWERYSNNDSKTHKREEIVPDWLNKEYKSEALDDKETKEMSDIIDSFKERKTALQDKLKQKYGK